MKKTLQLLPLFILLSTIVLWASGPVSQSDRAKAEFIYLEAQNAYEQDNFTEFYMLLRRAALLDPEDPYIAGQLADVEIMLPGQDSAALENAYQRIKRRFYAYPDEYYGSMVAHLAGQAGRTDDAIAVWETLDSLLPSRTDPAMMLSAWLMERYNTKHDTADYNRAMSILTRLENRAGPTQPVSLRKIQAYLLKSDTTAVIRELQALEDAAPADVNNLLFIGNAYRYINLPDSSLRFYNRASQLEPENGTVYLTRADFFAQTGDSVAYDREVFQALESQEIEFDQKFQLLTDYVVKIFQDSTQHSRIEELFDIMLDLNPGEADLHDFYGRYLATKSDFTSAAEQFSYSLDLDPEHVERWQTLCQAYADAQDNESLFNTAMKAYSFFPKEATFPLLASSILIQHQDYDKAYELLDTLDIESLPNNNLKSVIMAQKGDILYQLELPDSANTAYAKAIEYNPDNYMAMNNCAYFNAVRGANLDQADLYASIATASDSSNPTYLDTYAWVKFKRKEYKEARELIDKVLSIYGLIENETPTETLPDSISTPVVIPENFEEVIEETVAEEVETPTSEIYDHAGDIYYMTGDHVEALQFWKEALKLDPENPSIEKKVKHKAYFFE